MIDDVLNPDNLNNSGKIDKVNKGDKVSAKQQATRSRLESLKDLLKSDTVDFNTNDHLPNAGDFPQSTGGKVINYEDEDKKDLDKAEETIIAIINNYISNDKIKELDKVKGVIKSHITKLADLELLVRNSKRNMIMLQEAIDIGDMGKDMFDGVYKFQGEMRTNIEARSKHIDKCEIYWENYSKQFGLDTKEEEVIRKTEVKEDDKEKTNIFSITDLNRIIEEKMASEKIKNDRVQD